LGRLGSYASSSASQEYSVINPPSTCKYAEFRRAAYLPKVTLFFASHVHMCPTASKTYLPISSPTLVTQLTQPMTSTAPSPTRSPAQQNVGAIVGGTVVGSFAGIMILILLGNATFLLYRWRKRSGDLEANRGCPPPLPPPPPASSTAKTVESAPTSVEMTQVSFPVDEMLTYQRLPSGDISPNSVLDTSATALQSSSMDDMKALGPNMRKMSIRSLPHEMISRPPADAPPSLYLVPSDPFASLGLPVPVDSEKNQQQEPQHQTLQRTQNTRLSVRQSRSDSLFQPTQPTIPEQEMEFIAQEVVTFILTDAMERRTSHDVYSSPPISPSSPTLEHIRHSPTLSYVQRSPTMGFSTPPLVVRKHLSRTLSRGSSMEGV